MNNARLQSKTKKGSPKAASSPSKGKAMLKAGSSLSNGQLETVPVAQSRQQRRADARISVRKDSGQRVINREFIGNVNGSATFGVQSYYVNPGLPATFPWLSNIANNYEQYTVHSMSFEYISRSPTDDKGSILMAPDYDAIDNDPQSESVMAQYSGAVEDTIWKNITCFLKHDAMHPIGRRKFIRNSNIAGDLKTFDVAEFYIAAVGTADNSLIGKLWINYDIEFFAPSIDKGSTQAPAVTSVFDVNVPINLVSGAATPMALKTYYDPLRIAAKQAPGFGSWTPPAGVYNVTANLCCVFSNAATVQLLVSFQKNGGPIATGAVAAVGPLSGGAGCGLSVSPTTIITCSGTDVITLVVTAISSTPGTGTFQVTPNNSIITWVMA